MKYFISFILKYKDTMMAPITHYGNVIMVLPHEIKDASDIHDLQNFLNKDYKDFDLTIIWFQKLPV